MSKTPSPNSTPPISLSHIAVLVVLFAVSRWLGFRIGLRYLTQEVATYWQFLDLDVLQHHLARGLLNLHAQPPLLNTLVGLAEKVAGPGYGSVMLAIQLALGLGASIAVYVLLVRLRIPKGLSLGTSLLLMLNPTAVVFEYDVLYTVYVYALHCFIALALVCYVQRRSRLALGCVISLAVALTLLRSSYQWPWVVAFLGVLAWQLPRNRSAVLKAGTVAVLLVLAWPAKNYFRFHHFISSTWAPFSMAKHWRFPSERERLDAWVNRGDIPTFAPRASELDPGFPDMLRRQPPVPAAGVPELDDIVKQTGGAVNWNSLAMLQWNDAVGKDVSFLMHRDPKVYLLNVARGAYAFFEPPLPYFNRTGAASAAQYAHIATIDKLTSRFCCNLFGQPDPAKWDFMREALPSRRASLWAVIQGLCIGAVLSHLALCGCAVSLLCGTLWREDADRRIVALVLLVSIGYGFVINNLFEVMENMRYRVETHALVLIVLTLFVQQILDRRSSQAGKTAPMEAEATASS